MRCCVLLQTFCEDEFSCMLKLEGLWCGGVAVRGRFLPMRGATALGRCVYEDAMVDSSTTNAVEAARLPFI